MSNSPPAIRFLPSDSLVRFVVLVGVVSVGALLPVGSVAEGQPHDETEHAVPAWFLEHIDYSTRDGGRFVADNQTYRSDAEPFDAYVTEWTKGVGGLSLRGRMFAMRDGKDVGTMWEFVSVWDPGTQRVKAFQFGSDGTFGEGTMISMGEGRHRITQEFWRPDGTSFKVGHDGRDTAEGQEAASFDIGTDGSWSPRRSYLFRR